MAAQRARPNTRRHSDTHSYPCPSEGGSLHAHWHTRAPMVDALVLLPDFSLIALGWFLCRFTPLDRALWDGVERLVYVVLFPVLLFGSIVRHPTSLDGLLHL